uniref:WW domain-containing protein n=1 Tax=Neobodo designis TaxID=312471 RepID=A0A7S1ML33_NEODS|mmetsp:Transcript_41337/g.127746  ORF Transcript_41337/g.127746 Transcript_41337/m.127746 type:complete len:1027 (+) Transcript_41337:26-3106(+)
MAKIEDGPAQLTRSLEDASPTSAERAPRPDSEAPIASGSASAITRLAHEVQTATRDFPHLPPGYRFGLATRPTSIADLRLLPAAARQSVPDAPSNVLVVDLPKQKFRDVSAMRAKLVSDFMTARNLARVSGPIVCLDFVLLGDYIEQVQAEFLAASDAAQTGEQLRSARYDVGFGRGTPITTVTPSTVMTVLDFGKKLNEGERARASDLIRIFSRQQDELAVVEAFDSDTLYVAFQRASNLFSLFCSPFYSGALQQMFWQHGVFICAAHCSEQTLTRVLRGKIGDPLEQKRQQLDLAISREGVAVETIDMAQADSEAGDDDDEGSDAENIPVPDYSAQLFGQAAATAEVAVVGSDSVELPPELAALLEDAAKPKRPILATPVVEGGGGEHSALRGVLSRDALASGVAWEPNAPTAFRAANPGDALPDAEAELVTKLAGAPDAEAVQQELRSASSVLSAISDAGRDAVAGALVTPPSRFEQLLERPDVGNAVVAAKIHATAIFVRSIRPLLFQMVCRPSPPDVLAAVAEFSPMVVIEACLCDGSFSTVHTALRGPHFSRNLAALIASSPAHADTVAKVTSLFCGRPVKALFSSSGGARLIETCVRNGRADPGVLLTMIATRLANRHSTFDAANPHTLPQFLGVAAACMGANASADVQLVKALTFLLDRREVVAFLTTVAPKRAHLDALSLIVENLEGAALDMFTSARRSIAVGFVQRMAQTKSGAAAVHSAQVAESMVPEWLGSKSGECTSAKAPPFPALPSGWSVAASTSNGLYYFTDNSTRATTYRHPTTGAEYVPMPQAYVWERLLGVKDVADMMQRFSEQTLGKGAIDTWLQDQRVRNALVDRAVVVALRIRYPATPPAEGVATSNDADATVVASDRPAKMHREERRNEVPEDIAAMIQEYPPTGEPFPPLAAGFEVKVSASNGHFYFVSKDSRTGKEASSYKHPADGAHYPVPPQYFVRRSEVPLDVFASDFNLDLQDVKRWFSDQRIRVPPVDDAAMQAFEVKYKSRKPKKASDRVVEVGQ